MAETFGGDYPKQQPAPKADLTASDKEVQPDEAGGKMNEFIGQRTKLIKDAEVKQEDEDESLLNEVRKLQLPEPIFSSFKNVVTNSHIGPEQFRKSWFSEWVHRMRNTRTTLEQDVWDKIAAIIDALIPEVPRVDEKRDSTLEVEEKYPKPNYGWVYRKGAGDDIKFVITPDGYFFHGTRGKVADVGKSYRRWIDLKEVFPDAPIPEFKGIPLEICLHSNTKNIALKDRTNDLLGVTLPKVRGKKLNVQFPENTKQGWYQARLIPIEGSGRISKEEYRVLEGEVVVAPIESISEAELQIIRFCKPTEYHRVTHPDTAARQLSEKLAGKEPKPLHKPTHRERKLWWQAHGDDARQYARTHHIPGPSLEAVVDQITPDHVIAQYPELKRKYDSEYKEWEVKFKKFFDEIIAAIEVMIKKGLLQYEERSTAFYSSPTTGTGDTIITKEKVLVPNIQIVE